MVCHDPYQVLASCSSVVRSECTQGWRGAYLTTQRELILTGFRRGLASYPDLLRHSRKLDNRFSFYFMHDLPAMHFDGNFAAAQPGCYLLVKQTRHDQLHHFPFPLGQRFVTTAHCRSGVWTFAEGHVGRFCPEVEGAASRRVDTDRSLARSAWKSVPRKNRPVGYGMIGAANPRGISRRNGYRVS
jgi:hypothetical protein